MDIGTNLLVVASIVTAIGTWALALVTWRLAKKTADGVARSALSQELEALAPVVAGTPSFAPGSKFNILAEHRVHMLLVDLGVAFPGHPDEQEEILNAARMTDPL